MTEQKRTGEKFWFQLVYLILFAGCGFVLYSNTFSAGFHVDDLPRIVNNPEVRSFKPYLEFSRWFDLRARPVAMVTFTVNYAWHALELTGYHAVNIAGHILVSFLVYFFVLQLLTIPDIPGSPPTPRRTLAAVWVGLIFLSHPVQTQAVTYIVQRMTILAALFSLLALIFYLKARRLHLRQGLTWRSVLFYGGVLLCHYGALFSKPTAASLPLLILLVEGCFVRTRDRKIAFVFWMLSGALVLSFLVVVSGGWLPREVETISRSDYLATQSKVLVKYLQLLLVPVQQNLDYDFPLSAGFLHPAELGSLMILLIIIGLGSWCYRGFRLVCFGIFWFFLAQSMVSSIIPIRDFIFEHRLYFPLLGFSLVFVALVFRLLKDRFRLVILVCLVQIGSYSWLTYNRNQVWRTELSLWSDVVKKSPRKSRGWATLGTALANSGDTAGALKCYLKAVTLNPDDVFALSNIGGLLLQQGKLEQARTIFQNVLKKKTDHVEALTNLATIAALQKDYKRAITFYQKALTIKPMYVEARFNLGVVLLQKRDLFGALHTFKHVLYYQADHLGALCNLGVIYLQQKQYPEAEPVLQRAYQLAPHDQTVLSNLRKLYQAQGKQFEPS